MIQAKIPFGKIFTFSLYISAYFHKAEMPHDIEFDPYVSSCINIKFKLVEFMTKVATLHFLHMSASLAFLGSESLLDSS